MAVIRSLTVKIAADISQFEKDVRKLEKDSKHLMKIGETMKGFGTAMTAAVTLPLAGLGALATKLASDAGESASKMQAVFGPATDEMNKWIAGIRAQIPATTAQLQDMTSNIQALLVPMGVAPDVARGMSMEMVKLAGDLASFHNIPIGDALEKIRAGLIGEMEPLRSVGVALNQATIEAKALEMGLISGEEKLTSSAKAQAVYALVLEQTKMAQGDAARTADSAANSMKFFASSAKELATQIGNVLLPVVTPVIQFATDIIQKMQQASPETLKWAVGIGALAAAIGPLALAIGTVITLLPTIQVGIAAMTGPIGLAVVAFGSLVAAGLAVADNWKIISFEAKSLYENVKSFLADQFKGVAADAVKHAAFIKDGVVAHWKVISGAAQVMASAVSGFVKSMMNVVYEQLVGRFTAIVQGAKEKIGAITGFFKDMYTKVAGNSYVPDMMTIVDFELGEHLGGIVNTAAEHIGTVTDDFRTMSGAVQETAKQATDAFDAEFGVRFGDIAGKFGIHIGSLSGIVGKIKEEILGEASGLIDGLQKALNVDFEKIIKDFVKFWDTVKDIVSKIAGAIEKLFGGNNQFAIGPGGGLSVPGSGPAIGPGTTFTSGGGKPFYIDLRPTEKLLASIDLSTKAMNGVMTKYEPEQNELLAETNRLLAEIVVNTGAGPKGLQRPTVGPGTGHQQQDIRTLVHMLLPKLNVAFGERVNSERRYAGDMGL